MYLKMVRRRPAGEVFQHCRQIIGQFVHGEDVARAPVQRVQGHHRLAAVARLAVHVLEQVQRERARAVEERDVALLGSGERLAGELFAQARKLGAPRAPQPPGLDRRPELGHRRDQIAPLSKTGLITG